MDKRSIKGWRQVAPAAKSLRKRSPVTRAAIAVPAPAEPPPKAQWETEGGTVATPGQGSNKEKA